MYWTTLIPHVTVSAFFIYLVFRALHSYNRTIDAIIAKMVTDDVESQRKFDAFRDETLAAWRARTDQLIAEAKASIQTPLASHSEPRVNTNGFHNGETHDAESPHLDSSAAP